MSRLLDAYDADKDFDRNAYFTLCFDAIPSEVYFEAALKASQENMEIVIQSIPIKEFQMQIVYRDWDTENIKEADGAKDFPYAYLFRSNTNKFLMWIVLEYGRLRVTFLYDVEDSQLEKEVLEIHKKVRKKFGESKSPAFKVLTRSDSKFRVKNIQTEQFDLDIKELYNDDFKEIDSLISESIEQKYSGLILLHGTPGTGKTSYIKHLISKFDKKTFIFIQNEFINDLLRPDFISFLLGYKNAILIIEDAEKVLTSREHSNASSVVSTILQLTDGLFSDYLNIKIICTFNTSIARIDKALLRKGRMLANYEFKALSVEKANKLLESQGFEAQNQEIVLADIFNFSKQNFNENNDSKKIGFIN